MGNMSLINKVKLSWVKTWPGLVIPQRNPLLYNNGGKARGMQVDG